MKTKNPFKFFHVLVEQVLQQNVSMYTKWFHWILNEFMDPNEHDLMGMQWIHWFTNDGLVNWIHILYQWDSWKKFELFFHLFVLF